MPGATGAVQNFSSASALWGWQGRVEGGEPERVQQCYRMDSCLRRRGGRESPIQAPLRQRRSLPQGLNHHHEHPHKSLCSASSRGPKRVDCWLGYSVFRVFQCVSLACGVLGLAGNGPVVCMHDTRWHRPACAGRRVVWTKIQTNQPLTKRCAGETYYRGQSAIPPAGYPRRTHPHHPPRRYCRCRQLRRRR